MTASLQPAPTETGFCDATDGAQFAPLRCDLPPDHTAARHCERGVATWAADGTDVRWYAGTTDSGRHVYRPLPDGPALAQSTAG